jgi:hypothetical protein
LKIIVNRPVKIDIGPLDHQVRLPMSGRTGMSTVCDACGKPITDEFFIGGFQAGRKNLKLHEGCAE